MNKADRVAAERARRVEQAARSAEARRAADNDQRDQEHQRRAAAHVEEILTLMERLDYPAIKHGRFAIPRRSLGSRSVTRGFWSVGIYHRQLHGEEVLGELTLISDGQIAANRNPMGTPSALSDYGLQLIAEIETELSAFKTALIDAAKSEQGLAEFAKWAEAHANLNKMVRRPTSLAQFMARGPSAVSFPHWKPQG